MLKSLNISDFAVIRRLHIDFGNGLNLLTGETGSGKSIIVDALGLLLGNRASAEQIRTGEEVARVEGIFELAEEKERLVLKQLAELGVSVGDEEVLIRREINARGRSRTFINDQHVTTQTLRALQFRRERPTFNAAGRYAVIADDNVSLADNVGSRGAPLALTCVVTKPIVQSGLATVKMTEVVRCA